ncbi:MAG: HK97 gp10 family phage protein [Clostridia bacterium]|nr:HK97 gp10 family phage protein [Clostridia bacterium]
MNTGFIGLAARFAGMAQGIHGALEREISEAARECMEDARENAPVGTGPRKEARLVDSFSYEARGLTAEAKVVNPHAAYVEFGTGVRGAQSAGVAPGGRYDGDWPGMAAQPYMYPAAQRARNGFAERMMAAAVDAAAGRRYG